jgi:hypothetical protein
MTIDCGLRGVFGFESSGRILGPCDCLPLEGGLEKPSNTLVSKVSCSGLTGARGRGLRIVIGILSFPTGAAAESGEETRGRSIQSLTFNCGCAYPQNRKAFVVEQCLI